jgi:hypothetical protein
MKRKAGEKRTGLGKSWLPGRNSQRTKSVSELICCYFRYNNKQKLLVKGEKSSIFASNRAITKRDWEHSLRPQKECTNPITVGFQLSQYLKDHPGSAYDDLSKIYGVCKARVCQMVALYNRLPSRITEYLMNTDEPEILKYFTERRLRPLTLLACDEDKLRKFDKMRETLRIFR